MLTEITNVVRPGEPAGLSRDEPWQAMKEAMSSRIQELKRFTHLRIEERSKHAFEQDLVGLQTSVQALEKHVQDLKAHIKQEVATIPKVEALIAACQAQRQDLHKITQQLPQYLPGAPAGPVPTRLETSDRPSQASLASTSGRHASEDGGVGLGATTGAGGPGAAAAAGDKKRKEPVPRWYITEHELAGLSSYMRGRLTLDKVNSAVEEIAGYAEANGKLMAAIKGPGNKLGGPERKRAVELLHGVANKEGIKGRHWFVEGDLKEGLSIKLDKTGKSILTVLRHLGRLQEVRCTVEGASLTVYVLNSP